MNQQEFKNLNNEFLTKLNEKLECKSAFARVLQEDPFNSVQVIGISYKDSVNFVEVYNLTNNGDVARWEFAGLGDIRQG